MGQGYSYECKKCKHRYDVYPGIGMMYPKVYTKLLKDIEDGKYGEEWQKLIRETPYAAVNAETFVFICKECGNWEEGKDITLYAPDDPKAIANTQYGEKTVAEWGYVPYVTDWELSGKYHVLKRKYYKCNKCGHRMHKASEKEMMNLPCPECGTKNTTKGIICWD